MNDWSTIQAAEGTPEQRELDKVVAVRLLKQRTVMLSGEINRSSAQRAVSQLLLLSEESSTDPIKLFINSPGGDVDAGFAIFDVIRFIETPVKMIVAGLAASAAVLVLVAAPKDRRFSLTNARFLIHQPSTGVRGDASDIQIEASEILKCRAKSNQLLAEETGQEVAKVENDTKRNFWMDAEEALAYGLVSRIVNNLSDL